MDPRAGLDGCRKHAPTGIRSPDRPTRSESLYRLSFPVHFTVNNMTILSVPQNAFAVKLCRRQQENVFGVFMKLSTTFVRF
jgi:hypothetical protein